MATYTIPLQLKTGKPCPTKQHSVTNLQPAERGTL